MTKEAEHKEGKAIDEARRLLRHFDDVQQQNSIDLATEPAGSPLAEVLEQQQRVINAYKSILHKTIVQLTADGAKRLKSSHIPHLRDALREQMQIAAQEFSDTEQALIAELVEIARKQLDPPYQQAIWKDIEKKSQQQARRQKVLEEEQKRAETLTSQALAEATRSMPTALRLESPEHPGSRMQTIQEYSNLPGLSIIGSGKRYDTNEDTLEIIEKPGGAEEAFFASQDALKKVYEIRYVMQRGEMQLSLVIEATWLFVSSMQRRLVHERGLLAQLAKARLLEMMPEVSKKSDVMKKLFEGEDQDIRVKNIQL